MAGSIAGSTSDVYRIIPDDVVDGQLDYLPRQALLGYVDVLAALEVAPDGGRPYNDAIPEGPMRQVDAVAPEECATDRRHVRMPRRPV
ncbi:hypothetical protein ACLFMI_03230 [Pseudonocardia nantongensis]|uniref:hypothetical protein n=1 Tax=Pseudonocardia nantongensis TaxID=1181885 RepID=UPI00397DE4D8